jgi:peptidoglycan/LPS O-acetylase OafA/YrhL
MGLIRLLLAVAVLLGHCPPGMLGHMLHPALAVQCFYAISGFLIQFVIATRYAGSQGWCGRFYVSRALRIYPLYLLFLLPTLFYFGAGSFPTYVKDGDWSAVFAWLFSNAFIFGQDVLRFFYFNMDTHHFALLPATEAARANLPIGTMQPLGQSWTLAIEFDFYLLAPFLLLRSTRFIGVLTMLLIALRFMVVGLLPFRPQWLYEFFPCELAVFLSGALACRFYFAFLQSGRLAERFARAGGDGRKKLLRLSTLLVLSLCVLYRVIHVGFWGHFDAPPLGAPGGYWMVLILTIMVLPFAFHFSRSYAFDRYIGELSYPLYISHMTVLALFRYSFDDRYTAAIVLVICLGLSMLAILCIEQPLDAFRHRMFYRSHAGD